MERLTKLKNGRITYNEKRDPVFECGEFCDNCPTGTAYCRTMKKMIRKLAAYEDLEEQGLLVRLPVPLGSKVYWISTRDKQNPIIFEKNFCFRNVVFLGFDSICHS